MVQLTTIHRCVPSWPSLSRRGKASKTEHHPQQTARLKTKKSCATPVSSQGTMPSAAHADEELHELEAEVADEEASEEAPTVDQDRPDKCTSWRTEMVRNPHWTNPSSRMTNSKKRQKPLWTRCNKTQHLSKIKRAGSQTQLCCLRPFQRKRKHCSATLTNPPRHPRRRSATPREPGRSSYLCPVQSPRLRTRKRHWRSNASATRAA